MSTRDVGAEGETLAVKHLEKLGYRILETNLVTRYGEIDVVAKDRGDLAFVEVKLRKTEEFGIPAAAVNLRKQSKIVRSALSYVKAKRLCGENLRFDVLAIGPEPGKIELIKDAFAASPRYTL